MSIITHLLFLHKSTKDHKFLTPYGFKPLEELKEKDCVAVTRFLNENRIQILEKGKKVVYNKLGKLYLQILYKGVSDVQYSRC